METNPGLGTLLPLPPEVRAQIWSYFSLTTIQKIPIPGSRLAILQCGRTIYSEAVVEVYRNVRLSFRIDSNFEMSTNDIFDITTNATSKEQPNTEWTHVTSWRSFGRIPFTLMKSIDIRIEPAKFYEPAQVIWTWLQCRRVSKYLQRRSKNGLPHFKICLLFTYPRATNFPRTPSWITEDVILRTSLPKRRTINNIQEPVKFWDL